jgi:hypothetical protein
MSIKRELHVTLVDWEARFVLESISREMERLKGIAANSANEVDAANAANDYLEIAGLKERLTSAAKKVFGDQIADFQDS